jgi:hypothetical protein
MGKYILILISILTCSLASARIGETLPECKARYGESTGTSANDNDVIFFEKNSMLIAVHFYQEKCDFIQFQKSKENSIGIPTPLSENEIETLLKANGGEQKWEKRNILSMDKEWITQDGKIYATYANLKNFLSIATAEYIQRDNDNKKKQESENLKNF